MRYCEKNSYHASINEFIIKSSDQPIYQSDFVNQVENQLLYLSINQTQI